MSEEFIMKLPEGFAESLYRRHNGAIRSKKEIQEAQFRLNKLYKKYIKNKEKLKLIDEWWTISNIESHFQEPIWYNAHKRRKRYEENMKDSHRDMFYLLTNFDGNGREEFSQYYVISAEEIIEDFNTKYRK